jgi:hypothetical protein
VQLVEEQSAEHAGQHADRQKEAWSAADPPVATTHSASDISALIPDMLS